MEGISLNASKFQGSSTTITKKIEDVTLKMTPAGSGGQNAVNEANSYNKYDTLELTQDYLEYKTKSENSAVQSDANQLNTTIPQNFSENSQKESSDAVSTVTKTLTTSPNTIPIEEESISAAQLSSYTTSELKSLVQEGKITTADYNTEIKSRKVDEDTTSKPVENTKPASTGEKKDPSIVF